jgi:hypothetical protein
MAESFAQWLLHAAENYSIDVADKNVIVIGITGKSDSCTNKYEFIDQLLEQSVFCGRYEEEEERMINVSLYLLRFLIRFLQIDAYYSPFHQIVFLCLNSFQDGDVQEKIFDSDKVNVKFLYNLSSFSVVFRCASRSRNLVRGIFIRTLPALALDDIPASG